MVGPFSKTLRSSVTNHALAAGSPVVTVLLENYRSAIHWSSGRQWAYQFVQLCQNFRFDDVERAIEDIFGVDHRVEDLDSTLTGLIMTRHTQTQNSATNTSEAGLVLAHEQEFVAERRTYTTISWIVARLVVFVYGPANSVPHSDK